MPIAWNSFLDAILREVAEQGGTWPQIAATITDKVGFVVTSDAARNRFARLEEADNAHSVLVSTGTDAELRAALQDARREIAEIKNRRPELSQAINESITAAIQGMDIPAVIPPTSGYKPLGLHGVLLGADWQIGKLIKGDYDPEIAMRRVADWFDKSIDIMHFHGVEDVHLLLLGDLVENETIFPRQPYLIGASLYRQVFLVAEAIVNGVRKLLANFPTVCVDGLGGNHGYNQKTSHPETNFDCMAMNVARLMLENEDRLEFPEPLTPGEEHWYILHEVGNSTFFGMHGNQVKSKPFTKAMRDKLNGYYATLGPFDFAVTGHYHEGLQVDIGAFRHFAAGSTESNNTYAQQWLATGAQKGSQWTLVLDDDGLVAPYQVQLD